jgi:hypothetical protein
MRKFFERWWPLLILLLLPAIPLWRTLAYGETVGAFDQIRQMAPWNGPPPAQPWDVLMVDSVLQFYVWRDLVFEAWRTFDPPYWNPYQLAGTPLLANSQSGGFYPFHILVGVLRISTPLGIVLLAWLHLFLAGQGTFVLCRRLGASIAGGVVGGASFALSPFMLGWTALPSVIQTVAWIPWALAAVIGLYDRAPVAFKAENVKTFGTWWPWTSQVALLVMSLAMMLLAGHLQFAAYGLISVTFLGLYLAVARALTLREPQDDGPRKPLTRLWSFAGFFVLSLALGACLAAPQLLPVLRYGEFSHRRAAPTQEGYQAYAGNALRPFELPAVTYPTALGLPTNRSEVEGLSEYWPPLIKRGANFAESAIGVGPVVLGLAVIGFFGASLRRRHLPLAILGILALLIALGTILNWPMYFWLPGWSSTGSPARISVLFVLAACVAAGVALREDGFHVGKGPKMALAVVLALALLALAAVLGWLPGVATAQSPEGVNAGALAAQTALGQIPAMGAGLIGLALLAFALWKMPDRAPAIAVVLVLLVPAVQYATTLVRTGRPLEPVVGPADVGRIAVVNEAWGLLAAAPALLPPNTASIGRLPDLGGYDSLLHRDTVAMLNKVSGQDPAPLANGNMMFVKPTLDPRALGEMGVTELWSRTEIEQLGAPAAQADGIFRYSIPGRGRAFTDSTAAVVTHEGFSRQEVAATGPGKLIVRDRNMPGWSADYEGMPVLMERSPWREVPVPPGDYVVTFRYRPPGLTEGMMLFFAGALLLLVALLPFLAKAVSIGRLEGTLDGNSGVQ